MMGCMDLFLRRARHPQARDNYRVLAKVNGDEVEIGSIGVQFNGWAWAIDCAIPMREVEAEGVGKDRADCMRQFRAAWDKFSADRADRISQREAEAAAMSWSRQFDDPVTLPDGRKLMTLRDAGEYIAGLPEGEHGQPHWQIAMRCLIDAAEHGGIVMLAEIAMRRALAHGRPRPEPAPRKKPAKKYRVVR